MSSKRSVVFATVLLMCLQQSAMSQNSPRIVIVGAGLSGYSAAAKLIDNGVVNITVLEAENRTGGRIHSVPYSKGFIDLGAQWCHGQSKNVIYQIAQKYFSFGDTGFDNTDETFCLSNGKRPSTKQCQKLSSLAETILEGSYSEMEKFNGSLGDFFTTKYRKALQDPKFESIPADLANQMLEVSHKETNSFHASPTWFDISARLNAISESTGGSQYLTWGTKGFKTVFDIITKKNPDPFQFLDVDSKIQLNKEVVNIKWKSNSADKVVITCADGTSITADHVIVTASLGVLKDRYKTLFTPSLPDEKIKAINSIGFGTLGKIFLEFDKPFWSVDVNEFVGFVFLWTDDDLSNIKSTDKQWLIDISSFVVVDGFPNLLEGFVAGRKIQQFENISDTKLVEDCMWLLEKFLNKSLPRPISMKRTRWMSNKNFLGSYSYNSMLADRNQATTKALAEPLNIIGLDIKPVVFFAGEATDEKFPSYANGAVSSGWKAADKLLSYLNKIKG